MGYPNISTYHFFVKEAEFMHQWLQDFPIFYIRMIFYKVVQFQNNFGRSWEILYTQYLKRLTLLGSKVVVSSTVKTLFSAIFGVVSHIFFREGGGGAPTFGGRRPPKVGNRAPKACGLRKISKTWEFLKNCDLKM